MTKKPAWMSTLILVLFITPVAAKDLFRRPLPTYLGVYKFYDHAGKDWGCGGTRYAGHRGTDFKANMGTSIQAGSGGSLYYRYDGCSSTGFFGSTCGNGFGNHAKIRHVDGRVTIYAHMQSGTVIWPSSVMCGATIGKSGSSGSSSTPHLHFELWSDTAASARLDPYKGACDSVQTTDWRTQGTYPSGDVGTSCY